VAKWLGKQSFLDDLASLDPELYKGLISLKNMEGDPEDLSLNFTIAEEEFGVTKSIDLVPNGSNIAVTRANRMECECFYTHSPGTRSEADMH
jgi:ubiquitin-protein ligase E3 C